MAELAHEHVLLQADRCLGLPRLFGFRHRGREGPADIVTRGPRPRRGWLAVDLDVRTCRNSAQADTHYGALVAIIH